MPLWQIVLRNLSVCNWELRIRDQFGARFVVSEKKPTKNKTKQKQKQTNKQKETGQKFPGIIIEYSVVQFNTKMPSYKELSKEIAFINISDMEIGPRGLRSYVYN